MTSVSVTVPTTGHLKLATTDGIPSTIEKDDSHWPGDDRTDIPSVRKIGRYVVDGELGQGGMGVVYAGHDPELGRKLAIKVVRGATRGGHKLQYSHERLLREAQALARVSHRNVVGIYDVGVDGQGSYLVMERVEGIPLRSWMRNGPHAWRKILEVFVQAGRGLAAAHAAGIVHRDFKPSNVLVDDQRTVVLDFGLARALSNDGTGAPDSGAYDDADATTSGSLLSTRLTEANLVLGTTGYMAPEQFTRRPVGPWTDQFAFCVALYETLYDERPYPGRSAAEVAHAFRKAKLPLRPLRPGVPMRVHRALLRGLQMDKDARFPSMIDLLEALAPRRICRKRVAAVTALVTSAVWAAAWSMVSLFG